MKKCLSDQTEFNSFSEYIFCITIIRELMPTNYLAIKAHCIAQSAISERVIDNLIIYHAAAKNGLDKKFDERVKKFRHVTRKWDPSVLRYMKAMYIAGCVFKEKGLIHRYLEKGHFDQLGEEAISFLANHSKTPWRYSFMVILDRPFPEFFEMVDIFTDETFLLYSPSIENILKEENVLLWFTLTGFNGQCRQSYGSIIPFKGFADNDIFFFASILNSEIENEADVANEINENPIPFLMLFQYSTSPLMISGEHILRHQYSSYEYSPFEFEDMMSDFRVSVFQNFLELKLLSHESLPHDARAIYDKRKELLVLHAMTEEGYSALSNAMIGHGFEVDMDPDVDVCFAMIFAVKELLNKDVDPNVLSMLLDNAREEGLIEELTDHPPADYSRFDVGVIDDQDESDSEVPEADIDSINTFLSLIIPLINDNKPIPIEKLSAKAGLNSKTAIGLVELVKSKVGK